MTNRTHPIDYAISLGLPERGGLWQLKFVNPLESMTPQTVYVSIDPTDLRIGTKIDGIDVAEPGDRLIDVLKWLDHQVEQFPYYWPWEGTYVDKFGYDFEIEKSQNRIRSINISQLAYDIVQSKIAIQAPSPESEIVEEEVLEPGGAYVKFTVTLHQQSPVSEITINPFAPYPLEVASVMYEEDIETFHPRRELLLENVTKTSSAKSFTLSFSPIIAKRFTIIMRQKNYTKNTYLIRGKEIENKELWNKISHREAEVTLDLEDGMETVDNQEIATWTGWDIYLDAQKKHERDLEQWKKDLQTYLEYKAKLEEAERAEAAYQKELSTYRSEFKKATANHNARIKKWETEKKAYEKAKADYEANMKAYKKELRDLEKWEKQWG